MEIITLSHIQGFFRGRGHLPPLALALPPLGYAENSILHVNQIQAYIQAFIITQ